MSYLSLILGKFIRENKQWFKQHRKTSAALIATSAVAGITYLFVRNREEAPSR